MCSCAARPQHTHQLKTVLRQWQLLKVSTISSDCRMRAKQMGRTISSRSIARGRTEAAAIDESCEDCSVTYANIQADQRSLRGMPEDDIEWSIPSCLPYASSSRTTAKKQWQYAMIPDGMQAGSASDWSGPIRWHQRGLNLLQYRKIVIIWLSFLSEFDDMRETRMPADS